MRPRILGNGDNAGKLTKCFFVVGYCSFFPKILRLFSKILSIKLSLKVEIILLRKYNMIVNIKDAGVNRKRKPMYYNTAEKRLRMRGNKEDGEEFKCKIINKNMAI